MAWALGLSPRRCLAVHSFHAWTSTTDVLVLLLASADMPVTALPALSQVMAERLGDSVTLELAGAELVSRHTDYLAGHVSPLMLPDDVIVVATADVADLGMSIIYTATGDGGTALGISAADLLELSAAYVLPSPQRSAVAISLERDVSRPAHPFPVGAGRTGTVPARPTVIASAS